MQKEISKARWLCVTAMMGALGTVLMYIDFAVPAFMPSFIKLDVSELPALISAFAMGPLSGACVCLIKNLIHLLKTSTGGIGELSNFILGCSFVVPAGLIYKVKKSKLTAIIGSVAGAAIMALLSIVSNYFLVYPFYIKVFFDGNVDGVVGMYQKLNPKVETLMDALVWFNVPFTFVKGLISAVITILVYKPLSPIIKGSK